MSESHDERLNAADPTSGENSAPRSSAAELAATNGKTKSKGKAQKVKEKTKAQEEKLTFSFQMVPTEKLCVVNPDREGNEEGTEEFESLRVNIRKLGIMQPLLVHFDEKVQKWVVADGKRRFAVALLEGIAKVPCHIIRSKMSKGQEYLLAASGNAHRKDYKPWELANLFGKILTATKLKLTEVADAYGFSKSIVTDYAKLLDPRVKKNLLTEEEFKALKAGKYSAKKVTRMIDALENGKDLPTVLASKHPAKKGKPNQEPPKEADTGNAGIPTSETVYDSWPEPELGVTLTAHGKGEPPHIENLILIIDKWLGSLRQRVKNKNHNC